MEWAWHPHHDLLLGAGPFEEREAAIRQKPESAERIELRLKLFRLVRGVLPLSLEEAWRALQEAKPALHEAWRAYPGVAGLPGGSATLQEAMRAHEKATRAWQEAELDSEHQILALHAQECPDCPWDGRTIFPNGGGS